jgi:hypothetical protein
MNRLLLILILTFSFQSWTMADDIRDFEIEGMSIGDSTLDFFTKSEITDNTWDYFTNKEFTPLQFDSPSFAKTYDAVDIQYKSSDNKLTIMGLSGIIFYDDKKLIKECYKQMDTITSEIRSLFSNIYENPKSTSIHPADKTGKSIVTSVYFEFPNQDRISIQCYDYSVESGDQNHLRLGINTKEYIVFLSTKAYN